MPEKTQNLPFTGSAFWIWSREGNFALDPENLSPSHYQVRRFRRTFTVESPEKSRLVVQISADSRYWLFCNGRSIGRGPAKGDVRHQFYDQWDLTHFLKAGTNVLAAIVMDTSKVNCYGSEMGAPASFVRYGGGFILDGDLYQEVEKKEDLATRETWKVLVDRAWHFQTGQNPFGGAIGYMEDFHAEAEPAGWLEPDFDDSQWPQARVLYDGLRLENHRDSSNPYGLTQRIIPSLEIGPESLFDSVFLPGGGAVSPEWETLRKGEAPLTLPPQSRHQVLFALDAQTTAYPCLKLEGGKGATLKITYAEALRQEWGKDDTPMIGRPRDLSTVSVGYHDNAKGWTLDPRGKMEAGFSDYLRPDGRALQWEPFHWRTFQFVELDIETAGEPLTLNRWTWRFTGYPWNFQDGFHCSDEDLNRFPEISRRTLRLCSHETFEDCPFYEQVQYAGDTQITSWMGMLLSGNTALSRQAVRHFDWSRLPDGLTMSSWPSHKFNVIPAWSLSWINMAADFYFYTGDLEELRLRLPGLRACLDWFRRQKDETGLPARLPFWNFADWSPDWDRGQAPGWDEGPTCALSAQYLNALRRLAELETALGHKAQALALEAERADGLAAFNRLFWSENEGLYTDRPGGPEMSQYGNGWAILCDAAIAGNREKMLQRLPEDPALSPAAFFGRYFLFKALIRAGRDDKAMALLDVWREMAGYGLSVWAEELTYWRSLCHAWSAWPLTVFYTDILGLEPAVPGFQALRVAPHFCGLQWAQGRIPHPQGTIAARWERQGDKARMELECPVGLPLVWVNPFTGEVEKEKSVGKIEKTWQA